MTAHQEATVTMTVFLSDGTQWSIELEHVKGAYRETILDRGYRRGITLLNARYGKEWPHMDSISFNSSRIGTRTVTP